MKSRSALAHALVVLLLPAACGRVRAPRGLSVPEGAEGLHVVTADLGWGDWELRDWAEMMVEVAPAIPERED